jgi:hypothetical protein
MVVLKACNILLTHISLARFFSSAALLGYGWSDKPSPKEAGPPNTLYNFENWADQLEDFVEQVCNMEYSLSAIQQMYSLSAMKRGRNQSLSATSVAELDT